MSGATLQPFDAGRFLRFVAELRTKRLNPAPAIRDDPHYHPGAPKRARAKRAPVKVAGDPLRSSIVAEPCAPKPRTGFRCVSEAGEEIASGSFMVCADALRKRFHGIAKGAGATIDRATGAAVWRNQKFRGQAPTLTQPNTERWTIVRPDGTVAMKHEWTVLL